MLEHLYGQVNPQNLIAQLGTLQGGGLGPFGNPQLSYGFGGIGGTNPTLGQFGSPVVDPVTAAYIQQQLVQQTLLGGGISPHVMGQVAPHVLANLLTQSSGYGQTSPFGQISPFGQTSLFGQTSPYTQIFGQVPPYGQTSPWGQLGQSSPYTQGYPQISPYAWNALLSQTQNPPLALQAALAAQYLNPQLQQLSRVPFGVSPFTQHLGTQHLGTMGVNWPGTGRGISPFGQNIGFGTSPFQSVSGFGGIQ